MKGVNRLAGESSPYLLQHSRNPVDWFPWSEQALQQAQEENKPIFLSIGYSACHWCHVMERESFEDKETADILNEHFISIKVDREEHPELDEIYMAAVQMLTGRGGWPLSVFLTPNLEPFFGGTYFPPDNRHGLPSFKAILRAVVEMWQKQPEQVARSADAIAGTLCAGLIRESPCKSLDASFLSHAIAELKSAFDPTSGGFGGSQKFPDTGAIALLLRQYLHTGDDQVLKMATLTLDCMANGGIHDQIGGGFHRYTIDAHWLIPHFEKMLSDNALLAGSYLDAWQITGKALYRRVATDILDYVLRDMSDSRGGFHSSQDADSEGKEGKYYLWRPDEVESVLGTEKGRFFCEYYGISKQGNFEGDSILHMPCDPVVFAHRHDLSEQQLYDRLTPLQHQLLAERNRRIPPGKDDKVLAAWNGLMISALAHGYQVLGEKRYLAAAEQAADFILNEMVDHGTLLRAYRNGVSNCTRKLPGCLDDYAEVSCALIDLYEASFNHRWLAAANQLVRKMLIDFWDEQHNGFFYTSAAHQNVLFQTKPVYDGPVPSGNSTAALVLLRLSKYLDDHNFFTKAECLLTSIGGRMHDQPRAHLRLLCTVDFYLSPTWEIAIAGRHTGDDTGRLLEVIHRTFIPNKILALIDPDADSIPNEPAIPLLAGKQMYSDKATVYLCKDFSCKQPLTDVQSLEKALEGP